MALDRCRRSMMLVLMILAVLATLPGCIIWADHDHHHERERHEEHEHHDEDRW